MTTAQQQQQQQARAQAQQHTAAWDAIRDQLEVQLDQEESAYRIGGGGGGAATAPLHHEQGQQQTLPTFAFSDGGDLDVCRRKMCEWAFNVVDYFDYSRDLVSTSLSHVDRYVAHLAATGEAVCKRRYQSISVTALYVTLKMQGTSSAASKVVDPKTGATTKRRARLNIRTFVELSRGILSIEALEEEERRMLDGLGYRLNPPTPVGFVEYLVPLLLSAPSASTSPAAASSSSRVDDRTLHYVYELARYYTELSVFERDLSVLHRPSCVAFSAILCAVSAVDASAFGSDARSFASEALERIPSLRAKLSRGEVEDAWGRLATLCPLEALDWPGMAEAADGQDGGSKSPNAASAGRATPIEDDNISHISPTSVANFR